MKQADDRISSNLHRALNLNSKSCSSQNRKLHLVLDLDHTLLHSTELDHVTPQEEYLKTKTDDHSLEGDVFMDSTMITKLRPFVRTFLKEASHMFEMHIYTTGNRAYALRMAELLDPEQEYFFTSSSRVISCNDHSSRGQKKCLDLVRGCEDSNVLILDDTREAWTKENQDNLIVIRRYYFFKYSSQTMCLNNRKSLAELKTGENDYLEHILQLLKQVHAMFFVHKLPNKNHFGNDVRQVLKTLRKRVLKGCEIVFDCHDLTRINNIWKMAEELGATCSTRVDAPSVTHVIATNTRTKNSLLAVKNKKLLVRREWIESASYMWEKQPEHKFFVPTTETYINCD